MSAQLQFKKIPKKADILCEAVLFFINQKGEKIAAVK